MHGDDGQKGVDEIGRGCAGAGHKSRGEPAAQAHVHNEDGNGADRNGDAIAGDDPFPEWVHNCFRLTLPRKLVKGIYPVRQRDAEFCAQADNDQLLLR